MHAQAHAHSGAARINEQAASHRCFAMRRREAAELVATATATAAGAIMHRRIISPVSSHRPPRHSNTSTFVARFSGALAVLLTQLLLLIMHTHHPSSATAAPYWPPSSSSSSSSRNNWLAATNYIAEPQPTTTTKDSLVDFSNNKVENSIQNEQRLGDYNIIDERGEQRQGAGRFEWPPLELVRHTQVELAEDDDDLADEEDNNNNNNNNDDDDDADSNYIMQDIEARPSGARESRRRFRVPERKPILVSSSDNSYVSASPIQVDEDDDDDSQVAAEQVYTLVDEQQQQQRHTGWSNERPSRHAKARRQKNFEPAEQFQVRRASIIKTRDSLRAGALFINFTITTNLNACLVECLLTELCDTAIYQETPVDLNLSSPSSSSSSTAATTKTHEQEEAAAVIADAAVGAQSTRAAATRLSFDTNLSAQHVGAQQADGLFICYLFQCAKSDGYKCKFTPHNYYVSSTLLEQQHPTLEVYASAQQQQQQAARAQNLRISDNVHYMHPSRHFASISARAEELGQYDERDAGFNSAVLAIVCGIGATAIILMAVTYKMQTIHRKLLRANKQTSSSACKSARPSLASLPDTTVLDDYVADHTLQI